MTKERKAAIEMWESIVCQLPCHVGCYKQAFMEHYSYEWQNDCWLCQYCRKDYRSDHIGRENIESEANKCESCPLYKYEIARGNVPIKEDACGCEDSDWLCKTLWGKFINTRRSRPRRLS